MSAAILSLPYRSSHPFRTLVRLFDSRLWQYLAIQLTLGLKSSPLYVAPVYIAALIRLLSADDGVDLTYLAQISAAYALLLLANPPLTVLAAKLISQRSRRMEWHLRAAAVQRLQQLSMSFHGEHNQGALHSKVMRDVQAIVTTAIQLIHLSCETALGLVVSLAIVGWSDWRALLFFVLTAPPAALIMVSFKRIMSRRNHAHRVSMESMASRVGEMLTLIPVTRAHGAEDHEVADMEQHLESVYATSHRVDLINAWFIACSWLTMQIFGFGLLVGSAVLVSKGVIKLDQMLLYHGLYWLTISNLQSILNMTPILTQGFEAISSLGEVLECPDLERNRGGKIVTTVPGAIRFEHVSFQYESKGPAAVTDFNLQVRAGECIAFVGESGSGKSTLMNLLIGFWRPQQGTIYLDGVPQDQIDLRSWRQHLAVVPQQTVLFSGTLRENIAYGLDQVSDADVASAIDAAHLGEVVANLPQGLDTPLGENGVKLSGGQRQRVAIARAIIRKPRIIILDEATSALDVTSEQEVQLALNALIQGRTTFIVAHRLSTIRRADRIVVMQSGVCIESGPREELLRDSSSRFAHMEKLQGAVA